MEQAELRNLLLGPAFQPKVEDIPTPKLMLDAGVPADTLRMVSMSATEREDTFAGKVEPLLRTALLVAQTLRMRDSGGVDGKGTHVFGKMNEAGVTVIDAVAAQTLLSQDASLIDALAEIIKPFLGLDTEALPNAKNDSGKASPNAGGSASPSISDSAPSENANTASETAIS